MGFRLGIILALVALMERDAEAFFEIYGFVQTDYAQDFKRVDPAWKDSLRPSRIPVPSGGFGGDGQSILSVRQTRFGVKTPNTKFEFDFFGVGRDEGKTTPRLRHAYGQWRDWLMGQTHSLFMNVDSVPNTLDYSGPCGMIFLRNPQIRWSTISDSRTFALAIEAPASSVDHDIPSPAEIQGDDKLPDLTTQYRVDKDWGNVSLAGILRRVGVEYLNAPSGPEGAGDIGWGLNLTSRIKVHSSDQINFGIAYGHGFGTYIDDSGADVVADIRAGTIQATSLPILGLLAYYDHRWSERWNSAIGYSRMQIRTSPFQSSGTFRVGEYASLNLLYAADTHILLGGELLWGRRRNRSGERGDDIRTHVSFRYHFSGVP